MTGLRVNTQARAIWLGDARANPRHGKLWKDGELTATFRQPRLVAAITPNPPSPRLFLKNGSPGRTRTSDRAVNSR